MHSGSLQTLEEVIRLYNEGGGHNQTADLQPLHLTDSEIKQLVTFLQSICSPEVDSEAPDLPNYEVVALGKESAEAENNDQPVTDKNNSFRESRALSPLPAPFDTPFTEAKAELGKHLFFDPRLSADGSTSCHSCHSFRTGGSIQTPISMGGPGTSHWRNSQTILNVAYYGKLNEDGAKNSIESQNSGAWTGAVAGNLDPTLGEERLAQISDYVERFEDVFGADLPRWNDALQAVATYQRTLNSIDTPLDRYLQGETSAISESAIRGFELFPGKANCIACHHGPAASDDSYHALGVPQYPDFLNSPIKQITFRYELTSKGVPRDVYKNATTDDGLHYVTKRIEDRGKFRTPSLRALVHTTPYMHNRNSDSHSLRAGRTGRDAETAWTKLELGPPEGLTVHGKWLTL
ncbi:Cytochrome c551 peroxidase precursor [Polystyrenella longa]|uniref:Cytochrome c551 peroxidase n=2 Tax=Polystyrenella longa TaxID=2528007 RepID=A0A518CTI4_9PLAN|nr:Cytochrome c551 peroxidase precursor [Polystyrenella longa]